jgi:hypothetical protein
MQPQPSWIATASGTALVFIATSAYAIHLTQNPASASTLLAIVMGSANLGAWALGRVATGRSDDSPRRWLLGLGDVLLPINLYALGFAYLGPIKGHIPFSASLACLLSVAYYIFSQLLTRRIVQAYLLIGCGAITFYLTHFTINLSFAQVGWSLVGVVGLGAVISWLLRPPLRRHYSLATLALALTILGLFWPLLVNLSGQWLIPYVISGVLLLITSFNRDTKLGLLLAVSAGGSLTLSVGITLQRLGVFETGAGVAFAVGAALLIVFSFLLTAERFWPFNDAAHFLALAMGFVVIFVTRPLWRGLAESHFQASLAKAFQNPASTETHLTGGGWFDVLALLLITLTWTAAAALRRPDQPLSTSATSFSLADALPAYLSPLAGLAVLTALTTMIFGQIPWQIGILIVVGAGYGLAAGKLGQHYFSRPLTIAGYLALALASVVSVYNLTWAISIGGLVAVLFFIFSEMNRSVFAFIVSLLYLVSAFLLVAFKAAPERASIWLVALYVLVVLMTHWSMSRGQTNEARRDSPIKAQLALTLVVIVAAFTMGASVFLRQFHPLTFLIIALSFIAFSHAWEPLVPLHRHRYVRVLFTSGCYLTHLAAGLLIYCLLRQFQVSPEYLGLAMAGLSIIYLIMHRVLPGETKVLSRATVLHFTHYFTVVAVVLTILYCPLGVRFVLVWLLVTAVHLGLSASDETSVVYPMRVLRALSMMGLSLAAINFTWRAISIMTPSLPPPNVLTRPYSMVLNVSVLFALGLLFTVLMNRDKSVVKEAASLVFISTATGLVVFTTTLDNAATHGALGYVYLLLVSRVAMTRTGEEGFSPLLTRFGLWSAGAVLTLLLVVMAAWRNFPLALLGIMSLGYVILTATWEQRLPAYVHQRLRRPLLTNYYLAHIAIGLTLLALLQINNAGISSLAYAGLAGLHLLAHYIQVRREANHLQADALWHFTHYFALLSIGLALISDLSTSVGSWTSLALGVSSLGARFISGKPGYEHLAAVFAVGAIEIAGRAGSIQLAEYYTAPLGVYFGWMLYRYARREITSDQLFPNVLKLTLAVGLFLCLVGFSGWQFARTLALVHLIFLGVGALISIHLFLITRITPLAVYVVYGVLILEAVYSTFWGQPTPATLGSFVAIGLLIIGDLLVTGQKSAISNKP